jgi:hypothetical protein
MGITAAQNIIRGGSLTATSKDLEEMVDTPFDFLAINKSKELGPAKAKSKLGNNTKISQEQINHILIVGRYAKTMKEVAERTGLNATTVSKYLQLNGVTKFHKKVDIDAVDSLLRNQNLTFLEISKACKCGHKLVSDRASILGVRKTKKT